MNVVVLKGSLPRDPERREVASGSVVLSFDLATIGPDQRVEAVPIAWADPPAGASLAAGQVVVVVGRVRRRFFRVGAATQSRTEVVAVEVIPERSRKKAQVAVDRACVDVAEGFAAAAARPGGKGSRRAPTVSSTGRNR